MCPRKKIKSVKKTWLYKLVVLLAWVNFAVAQNNEINIKQQIEQCNILEDDKPNEAINLADQLLNSLNKFEQPIEFGELLGFCRI